MNLQILKVTYLHLSISVFGDECIFFFTLNRYVFFVTIMSNPNILCQQKVELGAFCVCVWVGNECFVFLTCLFLEFHDALHEHSDIKTHTNRLFFSGTRSCDLSKPSSAHLNLLRCQPARRLCY